MRGFLLVEYYIRKNMEKALKLDKYDGQTSTSTCVDDTFYILNSSLLRCVASMNADATSVLIGVVGRLLNDDYIAVLNKKLGGAFADVGDDRDARMSFMICLNDVDVSCDYMKEVCDYSLTFFSWVIKS
jgi:hypothetical protein